jgi:undecaprenyl pyrophosphate synthase
MPRHIGIILDANRRLAQAMGTANLTCDGMTLTIAAAYGGRQQNVMHSGAASSQISGRGNARKYNQREFLKIKSMLIGSHLTRCRY